MVNIYKRVLAVGLLGLMCACTDTPRPEIPPGSVSDHKRPAASAVDSEQLNALATAVGDSIVHLVEGSFLQLAESQPRAQALFVAQPDKLPAVQELLQRYHAQLERKPFNKKEEKQWKRPFSLFAKTPNAQAKIKETTAFLVYQKPIQVKRRNCASCEEPSLLNFMATDLDQLRVFSAQGKPEGYEIGTIIGLWVIHFPKQGFQQ
ncbi:hypothetical protein TH61_06290 [Rufibacter sp. DG15C]|uniref:hypothetical protein n=1 Tax=Rufibacter sp. DG15C TaxID=1379909 RepID=UPI00078D4400|nr:hypothetical protein [Rufibacter sp. DG15C]AMM50873.1 hypothetical protein TH61_06290 [Rufibacter sp. DG15C]